MTHGPRVKHDYTDVEFEVIQGEYRVGEESRERPGWFFTGRRDRHGNPLWYKPPFLSRRLIHKVAVVVICLGFAVALLGLLFG